MKGSYTFLIVDDNPVDRMICRRLLEIKLSVDDIVEVDSGRAALEWLVENRAKRDRPLVVLLDIRMPEMDGFAFLDAYAAAVGEQTDATRIMMLTSSLDPHDEQRAKQSAFVEALLNKPLQTEELERRLSA